MTQEKGLRLVPLAAMAIWMLADIQANALRQGLISCWHCFVLQANEMHPQHQLRG
jgi:hypothetical protein